MKTREETVKVAAATVRDGRPDEDGDDPVLQSLGEAEEHYRQVRDAWQSERDELRAEREAAARALGQHEELRREVERLRGDLSLERDKAERARKRARQLADGLKAVHRSLHDGNVYTLILRACAAITGATRGLYVTAWGEGRLQPRAAVDIDGYPQKPPSPFIRALCQRVVDGGKAFVINGPADAEGLPAPEPGEGFRNCLVAPAVMLKRFSGVVMLADKLQGDFDEDDIEQVLGVGDQAAIAVENRLLQDQLLSSYFGVVGVLADAIEAKDPYTHGHCEQVAHLGRLTAEQMGLDERMLSVVCFGGLLHDVGKIGVSDGVLNKAGKLLPEEWDLMRSHVRIGRDLLSRVPVLERVADVVLHHHERVDGGGYPDGLTGEQISLAARIIAVADSYSAMTTRRSYRESMTKEEACAELVRCKGTHFDPAVVEAFLAALERGPAEDPCPDSGCGLPPSFYHPDELRLALEGLMRPVRAVESAPRLTDSSSPG